MSSRQTTFDDLKSTAGFKAGSECKMKYPVRLNYGIFGISFKAEANILSSLALALILCLSPLRSQEVELFGYFETQVSDTELDNEVFQLYTNKLRVDLKSYLSDNITFAANYDYITYHGKTEWNILALLPVHITSTVPSALQSLYTIGFVDENFLDNAYIKLSFNPLDLTVGKQQISPGTGYVWNPTDIFNTKDVLDPTYEQPGHNAVRMDIPIGYTHTITVLYGPEATWRTSEKLLQFKGRVSHFDYALIGIERQWIFHDYTQFDFQNSKFVGLPEKRRLLGASTAGELFGMGIWAEYAYNNMAVSKNFYELVVGTDYTFEAQTYLMLEYYRNTLGKNDYRKYDLNDWMRLIVGEQKAISHDQVYALIRHPFTDLLDLGMASIYSISDNSAALVPTLNYSLWENVEITAYLNINLGKEGTAYSASYGNGGLLRARVYF